MKNIKNISLNLGLKLDISINLDNDEVEIRACEATVLQASATNQQQKNAITHTISQTENHYGIITLGAKKSQLILMPIDKEIELEINDQKFDNSKQISTHKTVKGRVDGLTALYRQYSNELSVGSIVTVKYDTNNNILKIYTSNDC